MGWAQLHELLFRNLTAQLIWNTVSLLVVVTALCAVVGTLAAWFVERTELPVPEALHGPARDPPRYPRLRGELRVAGHLPRHRRVLGRRPGDDPGGLPAGVPARWRPVSAPRTRRRRRWRAASAWEGVRTFWTVTVGQARLAILGGAILVGLVVLAEFGAFEILGYQTLTTEIYNEFQVGFNEPAACALSLILVLLGALLLGSEAIGPGTRPHLARGLGCVAAHQPGAAGPGAPGRAGRRRGARRPGPRRAGGGDRLPDRPGRATARCRRPHSSAATAEHLRLLRRRPASWPPGRAPHRSPLGPLHAGAASSPSSGATCWSSPCRVSSSR